jgi:hypothetical protein
MSNTVFRNLLVGAGLAVVALGSTAAMSETTQIKSDIDAATIIPAKATPLELYLTPEDAHRALTADRGITFIDVRDPRGHVCRPSRGCRQDHPSRHCDS